MYDRLARGYDFWEATLEFLFPTLVRLRREICSRARGEVLEVGVGTGRNLRFYPRTVRVVGIDLSPGMLRRAGRRARELGVEVKLEEMDI